jgi:ABC-type ATPase with predicted acetyltransferase domain
MSVQAPALINRGPAIARRFGVQGMPANPALLGLPRLVEQVLPHVRPGQVVLITGASGSGKSSLLDQLEQRLGHRALAVHSLSLPDAIAVDCLPQIDTEAALDLLGCFGLGEVYTYLSPACKLSTGQQLRLRLAMAWAQIRMRRVAVSPVLLCDEFATQLDPVSAGVLARLVRRQVSADGGLCFIAASCHDAIIPGLRPDLLVRCDFGRFDVETGQRT